MQTERLTGQVTNAIDSLQFNAHEDVSEYVAHLQLHMTLQARKLVPTLAKQAANSREQLLQQTQADFEKVVSRQVG